MIQIKDRNGRMIIYGRSKVDWHSTEERWRGLFGVTRLGALESKKRSRHLSREFTPDLELYK